MKKTILILLVFCGSAHAASIGPIYTIYDSDRIKSEMGFKASIGSTWNLWGSFERPDLQLVGQNMGRVETWGIGVGFAHEWDKIGLFGDFGYFMPSTDPADNIRHEAVSTSLCNDHCRGLEPPTWNHTVYKLSDDFGFRLGASYAITERFKATFAYRGLSFNESLDACTGADSGCKFPVTGSHWQNRKTVKFNAWEAGIMFKLR